MDLISLKNSCGFLEISPIYKAFTWSNNQPVGSQIWKMFNYVFANTLWFSTNHSSSVTILERVASDHSPLLLTIEINAFQGK